jgi:hypothetical protein
MARKPAPDEEVRERIEDAIDEDALADALESTHDESPHEDAPGALSAVAAEEAAEIATAASKRARRRNREVTPEDVAKAAEDRRKQLRMGRHYGP